MTIRALLALLIIATLAVSLTVTQLATDWVEAHALDSEYVSLPSFLEWASGPLALDTLISVAIGVLAALCLFLAVNALIARPLRQVRDAFAHFAARGERLTLPPFRGSPREIRDVARTFVSFAESVENAHAKDTEISRVKSDFISTAAHQLRTPLTGIRWSLEALAKEELTETQKLLVTSAVDKSHDLVGIVSTLLDISSIESGKYKYELAYADMNEIVSSVAADFAVLAKEAGVSLTCTGAEGSPRVRVDRERMKWVLNNLIENGIRYTPAGGSVHVTTEAVGSVVFTRVRDTGIGIREEDRNNIFERFYRAGNAISQNNQGNGLGLYIARTIVKDHNGELSFEGNAEGSGTTFTLSLPAA